MSVLPKRMLSCLLSAGLCLALSPIWGESAEAGRRRARPVILRGSDVIDFSSRARIVGRLENGRAGQEVVLKRRIVGEGRKIVRRKAVNEDLKVIFRLRNRTRTAIFRMVFKPREGKKRVSDPHRVSVRPLLKFDAEPNDVRFKNPVELRGSLRPVEHGRKVTIRFRRDGKWVFLKNVDVGDGRFFRTFIPEVRGHHRLRAVFKGDDLNARTKRHERIWIYRRGPATWYGPGFYGNTTACGQTLRKKTLGVAHRTLSCGTRVNFLYRGRTITVRVIDRGPYGKADWDLTEKTANRLNFGGRDSIGWWANR